MKKRKKKYTSMQTSPALRRKRRADGWVDGASEEGMEIFKAIGLARCLQSQRTIVEPGPPPKRMSIFLKSKGQRTATLRNNLEASRNKPEVTPLGEGGKETYAIEGKEKELRECKLSALSGAEHGPTIQLHAGSGIESHVSSQGRREVSKDVRRKAELKAGQSPQNSQQLPNLLSPSLKSKISPSSVLLPKPQDNNSSAPHNDGQGRKERSAPLNLADISKLCRKRSREKTNSNDNTRESAEGSAQSFSTAPSCPVAYKSSQAGKRKAAGRSCWQEQGAHHECVGPRGLALIGEREHVSPDEHVAGGKRPGDGGSNEGTGRAGKHSEKGMAEKRERMRQVLFTSLKRGSAATDERLRAISQELEKSVFECTHGHTETYLEKIKSLKCNSEGVLAHVMSNGKTCSEVANMSAHELADERTQQTRREHFSAAVFQDSLYLTAKHGGAKTQHFTCPKCGSQDSIFRHEHLLPDNFWAYNDVAYQGESLVFLFF